METLSKPPERITTKQAYCDILRLFLPCLVELFLGQLVTMVDTIMVSGLGTKALNAVGICGSPTALLTLIFAALNVGTTATISRAKGEENPHKINQIALHAIAVNFIAGLMMAALGWVLADSMIAMMGSPDPETAVLAGDYLRYRIVAMPFIAVSTANTAILRGIGNAHTPMVYNLLANGINVLFNWLLIHGIWIFPEMGVTGAALATTISNLSAMLISCFVLLLGHNGVQLDLKGKISFDGSILWNISKIGAPTMAEQIVFRIGDILFARLTISLGGTDYAAHQLCWNILNLIMLLGSAMQMTAAPLTGQSLGRKDVVRAQDYHKHASWLLAGMMALGALVCILFGKYLLMMYSPEPDVLEAGLPVLRVLSAFLPVIAFQYVSGGVLIGAGDTKFNALFFVVTVFAVRLPLALLFKNVLGWGLLGINLATLADILMRHVLFHGRYKLGKWKTVKLK